MRLNKYIAQAGIASRRKADELILDGQVKINGAKMDTPGYDVAEDDVVEVSGRVIKASEKLVYYALNKPIGFITTTSDELERPTVLEFFADVPERIFPVGRLDSATSGLLLVTNDGALAYHIAHPSQKVWKTYVATVSGKLTKEALWTLRNGVDIGGYTTRPAFVTVLSENPRSSVLEIKISEGKNRQVRKMLTAVGHPVSALERTAIGNVQLGHLKPGQLRRLSPAEIEYLKNC